MQWKAAIYARARGQGRIKVADGEFYATARSFAALRMTWGRSLRAIEDRSWDFRFEVWGGEFGWLFMMRALRLRGGLGLCLPLLLVVRVGGVLRAALGP